MSVVPVVEKACVQSEACKCAGACTGYESKRECPPLIVLAIAAMNLALGEVPKLVPVMAGRG
jgi:predicted metal-binding protein